MGTPTMGGIMFIIGIVVSAVITIPIYYAMSGGGTLGILGETVLMQVKVFGGFIHGSRLWCNWLLMITLKW